MLIRIAKDSANKQLAAKQLGLSVRLVRGNKKISSWHTKQPRMSVVMVRVHWQIVNWEDCFSGW